MPVNMSKATTFLIAAAIFGALAVSLGAFGAHGLKKFLSDTSLTTYRTAVEYHFYHVFALMGLALWMKVTGSSSWWLSLSGWLFIGGIMLFSGSLYLLAVTGIRWLGAITPLGGLCFIVAWVSLAVALVKEGN